MTYLCAEGGIERAIEGILAQKRGMRGAALDASSEVTDLEVTSFMTFARAATAAAEEPVETTEAVATDDALVAAAPAEEPSEAVLDAAAEAMEEEVAVEGAALDAPPPVEAPAEEEPAPEEAAPTETSPVETPPAQTAPITAPEPTEEPASEPAEKPTAAPATPRRRAKVERADNRLRLARVVLDAGFPADAVRASYEALAEAVRGLLDGDAPATHGALVAAVYKELIPAGRLPLAAHAALATLHDLTSLDAHGIEVDPALARQAVADAEAWVQRLAEA